MSGKPLINKVVIVTGGSGGIGSATVNRLLNSGAKVVSVFRKNYPAHHFGENCICFRANLTKPEEWTKLISFVVGKYGRIDVLINCAGLLEPGNFTRLGENEVKKMIEINLTSVITGIYKTLKVFGEQREGHIINIGSLGGIVPMPYASIYCAAKFGLRGFTFSLAEELKGTGIDISLVSPGSVTTKMLDREALDENAAISFVGKPVSPDKVADSVLKLILKPRLEVIIPVSQSILSKLLVFSPSVFSRIYKILHRIGTAGKKYYINRYFNLKLVEER